MSNISWSVTTTKGFTYIEGLNFMEKPGMRKPWVQLVRHLEATGDSIEQMSVFTDSDRISIHTGPEKPLSYGVQYIVEVDGILGESEERNYVDVAVEYKGEVKHIIFDDDNIHNVRIRVGEDKAMLHTTKV